MRFIDSQCQQTNSNNGFTSGVLFLPLFLLQTQISSSLTSQTLSLLQHTKPPTHDHTDSFLCVCRLRILLFLCHSHYGIYVNLLLSFIPLFFQECLFSHNYLCWTTLHIPSCFSLAYNRDNWTLVAQARISGIYFGADPALGVSAILHVSITKRHCIQIFYKTWEMKYKRAALQVEEWFKVYV